MHNRIGGISGVPGTVEHRIPGLAWHSGLRIQYCCNCGIDCNWGLDLIPTLGTPYAAGAALKRQKKKKKGREIQHCIKHLFSNNEAPENRSNACQTPGKTILNLRFHIQTNLIVSSWNKFYFQCASSQKLYLPLSFTRKLLEDLLQIEDVYWNKGSQNATKQTPHIEAEQRKSHLQLHNKNREWIQTEGEKSWLQTEEGTPWISAQGKYHWWACGGNVKALGKTIIKKI